MFSFASAIEKIRQTQIHFIAIILLNGANDQSGVTENGK
jgi:hypothetical protein